MSRKSPICVTIHEYNRILSVAFQADVESLLTEFEKSKSLEFQVFSNVWKKMMFSYVFSEQQYYTFVKNFMENAFLVIKKFIMFPRNIYTEVGALYLLYGMYFKQTVKEWIKIRVTLEEYEKIQDLIERLKSLYELEPLFVYNKLKKVDAFEYVFQRRIIAPELHYLKSCTDFVDDTFQSLNHKSVKEQLGNILNEGNFLKNFEKTTENYRQALEHIADENPGLGMFKSTLIQDLHSLLDSETLSSSDSE
ncbi:snRNA-activating protein complex subunit 1-like [Coccinella septempunctata]|uniref:snRNA-activating protein complex subunit 1-like n=1 Tax=Coccinella septempunctata TaxID=41139 RepID=UPI001D07ABC5|nr:snRNA-activating protein complex subunit 1-like [Coccinella septempunctata]